MHVCGVFVSGFLRLNKKHLPPPPWIATSIATVLCGCYMYTAQEPSLGIACGPVRCIHVCALNGYVNRLLFSIRIRGAADNDNYYHRVPAWAPPVGGPARGGVAAGPVVTGGPAVPVCGRSGDWPSCMQAHAWFRPQTLGGASLYC